MAEPEPACRVSDLAEAVKAACRKMDPGHRAALWDDWEAWAKTAPSFPPDSVMPWDQPDPGQMLLTRPAVTDAVGKLLRARIAAGFPRDEAQRLIPVMAAELDRRTASPRPMPPRPCLTGGVPGAVPGYRPPAAPWPGTALTGTDGRPTGSTRPHEGRPRPRSTGGQQGSAGPPARG